QGAVVPPERRGKGAVLECGDSSPHSKTAAHQGSGCPRWKKPPLGPSSGTVASCTLVLPPSETSSGAAEPPMSVFTQPGCAELTLIFVPRSSWARWTVKALRAVFDAS